MMGVLDQLGRWPKIVFLSTSAVSLGCYALVRSIRSKFDSSKLYQDAVEALHNDSRISNALGKPVKVYGTDLGLIEFEKDVDPTLKTFAKENDMQLKIPVMGAKYGGSLIARCIRDRPDGDCAMSDLFVVANGKKAHVKFDKT